MLASRVCAAEGPLGETILFTVFATSAIVCAILMITNHNPVYSALWFALVTLSVCGLFLLQSAPFLAAATVIVYAGAIVVTFVFVIMLAQQSGATVYDQRSRQPFLATVAAFLLLGALLSTLTRGDGGRFSRGGEHAAGGCRESAEPAARIAADESESNARSRPFAVRRLFVRGRAGRHVALGGHDWCDCDRTAPPPGDAMTGDIERYLVVGAVLFVLGAIGFFTRRNLILMVLSAELMLHGVSLTLVTFGRVHHSLEGQAFTIFILTVAACEAGLALSLILALYQKSKSLDIEFWTDLREPGLPSPTGYEKQRSRVVRKAGSRPCIRG